MLASDLAKDSESISPYRRTDNHLESPPHAVNEKKSSTSSVSHPEVPPLNDVQVPPPLQSTSAVTRKATDFHRAPAAVEATTTVAAKCAKEKKYMFLFSGFQKQVS